MKRLDFTEEQKRKYRRLKVITAGIGISGLTFSILLSLFGFQEISELLVSLLVLFVCLYVYRQYRKILSDSSSTRSYSKFQDEIYAKTFKLLALLLPIESVLAYYLMFFQTEFLSKNLWLIFIIILAPAIILGIWAGWYEKKRLGALHRAP